MSENHENITKPVTTIVNDQMIFIGDEEEAIAKDSSHGNHYHGVFNKIWITGFIKDYDIENKEFLLVQKTSTNESFDSVTFKCKSRKFIKTSVQENTPVKIVGLVLQDKASSKYSCYIDVIDIQLPSATEIGFHHDEDYKDLNAVNLSTSGQYINQLMISGVIRKMSNIKYTKSNGEVVLTPQILLQVSPNDIIPIRLRGKRKELNIQNLIKKPNKGVNIAIAIESEPLKSKMVNGTLSTYIDASNVIVLNSQTIGERWLFGKTPNWMRTRLIQV